MGKRQKKAALLEAHPALREVLEWWSDKAHAGGILRGLRQEILGLCRSLDRLCTVRDCAAGLLRKEGEAAGQADFDRLDGSLHRLLWNFAIADEMAVRFQRRQRWSCRRLLIFVALIATGFWLLNYVSQWLPGILFGGITTGVAAGALLIALAGAGSVVERWRFQRDRGRFLVARTLAEALRVELAQRLAGTGLDTVAEFSRQHEVADHASFPKAALKAALECAGAPVSYPRSDGLEWARTLWLEDQLGFFGNPEAEPGRPAEHEPRVELERQQHRRAERRLKFGLAGLLLCLVLSLATRGMNLGNWLPESLRQVSSAAGAVSDLAAAVFGLWVGYYHQMAALHAVTAQKYHRARIYLIDALRSLRDAPDDRERRAIFARTGKLALAESADWGVHQREHAPRTAFR